MKREKIAVDFSAAELKVVMHGLRALELHYSEQIVDAYSSGLRGTNYHRQAGRGIAAAKRLSERLQKEHPIGKRRR